MYTMRRILFGILVLGTLFGASAPGPVQANITDLARKATIRRDTYGVPHILAETEEAAAFAHGYAAAEDHLGILARMYLRARGQQAAYMGEHALLGDVNILELGIYRVAKERFATLPPLIQQTLNAYAEGYNLFLSKNLERAPEWAFPITGIDV